MAKSSFTSSFETASRSKPPFKIHTLLFKPGPAVLLAVTLFMLSQLLISTAAKSFENGGRQIVNWKREWARSYQAGNIPGEKKVFFMGDSKITFGIIPEIFDERTGFTRSYNLALPGLSLPPHYFMLKDYLENNPPPYAIVLKPRPGGFKSMFFAWHAIEGASLREVLLYTFWGRSPSVLLNYMIPGRQKWKTLEQAIVGWIVGGLPDFARENHKKLFIEENKAKETYPHDWEYIYNVRYRKPAEFQRKQLHLLSRNRGYYYLESDAAPGGRMPDDYEGGARDFYREEDFFLDRFSEDFFRLTKKHNIHVIFVQDYDIDLGAGEKKAAPAFWDKLKEKYPNISFLPESRYVKYYQHAFFSDPLHLNPEGARIYTEAVAAEFLEVLKHDFLCDETSASEKTAV